MNSHLVLQFGILIPQIQLQNAEFTNCRIKQKYNHIQTYYTYKTNCHSRLKRKNKTNRANIIIIGLYAY